MLPDINASGLFRGVRCDHGVNIGAKNFFHWQVIGKVIAPASGVVFCDLLLPEIIVEKTHAHSGLLGHDHARNPGGNEKND